MNIQFLGQQYNTGELIRKRRGIKKSLLEKEGLRISKNILMLSGSTIGELAEQLDLFCLSRGIELTISQGDYGRYYEDALYGNPQIENKKYDFIYIHISSRNILNLPEPFEEKQIVEKKLQTEFSRIKQVVNTLSEKYVCPVICNNFELPYYRIMGNREIWDTSGTINFINRLNVLMNSLAEEKSNFYINDINYLAAYYGVKEWASPSYWYRYKYAMCIDAIPLIAQNLSAIIISLCGLNKKCFTFDLDNTLWGGVVGDDGPEQIVIGNDSPQGEAYIAFQEYVRRLKRTGIILGVISKNDESIAGSAFKRSEMMIKKEDFTSFIANWNPKSENLVKMALELNLGVDSFVFIDDNPVERDEIKNRLDAVIAPVLTKVENYINEIEECRLFEVTTHTEEDDIRTTYYLQNAKREEEQKNFPDYNEYLESLNMIWTFTNFEEAAFERITQLINKTNQFNLTTMRLSMNEVIKRATDPEGYLCIQGRMADKFGDNGLITILLGRFTEKTLYIELWLMSCRVLRRNGEYKLFEYLKKRCRKRQVKKIVGEYVPTKKNGIVKDFYGLLGFELVNIDEAGKTTWEYSL